MKNKLSIKTLIFEIMILVVCFITACLGMYFYFRQFKTWKSPNNNDNNTSYITVNNYTAYPIEYRKFNKSVTSKGNIEIPNTAIFQLELKDVAVKSGCYFEKGTILGTTILDEDIIANSFGYVINIEKEDDLFTLTYLDYTKVNLIFEFDNDYKKYIEYNKEYSCSLGSFDANISLSSMEIDYNYSGFIAVFKINKINYQKEYFIYDNESCTITLNNEEYEMYSIKRSLIEELDLDEYDSIQFTLVDNEGNYSKSLVTISVLGDYYVGLSSADNLENKSICVDKND